MDNHIQTNQRLLTQREAAKYLAISIRTLFSLSQNGRLCSIKLGPRSTRYDIADLDKFILDAKGIGYNREHEAMPKAGAVG
jgi:excisionase family DNA binding protein